jgi:D-alanine-D-alanine ligase
MKRRRVLVLVHPTLAPPDSLDGVPERRYDEWRTEYDVVQALRAAGHEVAVLGLDESLEPLRRSLEGWRPHLVFNLLEEFNGVVAYEPYVVGYLELMRQPYTGCNPRGLLLAHDKLLAKQVLMAAGIATPRAALVRRGARLPSLVALRYPLFVKSATEDASLGISQRSIVRNRRQLAARVRFIHRQTQSDALVEEYIAGREFYCAVLGNERPRCLPLRELRFGALRAAAPRIATRRIKWNRAYQRRHGIGTRPAGKLPPQLERELMKMARRACDALQLCGYARLDFRVRDDGAIFLLEANPNPCLAEIEDFAAAARAGGLRYGALLERIMKLGLGQRVAWRS